MLMATQHPDNACIPFWSDRAKVTTADETEEMYECFFTLNCDEYMWDWEGKFADEAMIDRLMNKHLETFKEHQIGRDRFITLRIPNIWEEQSYKLSRAYMSILSAAEVTQEIGLTSPPVFEIILPMTKKGEQLAYVQRTFKQMAEMHSKIFDDHDFGEGYIHIVPLIESVDDFYNSATVLNDFIRLHEEEFGYKPPYLRPFIARSDPALNAGFVPAMLGARLALREFYRVGKEHDLEVFPIIGTGSLPFRGGINPDNIKASLKQYEGVKTVSIQSAYRYDYPMDQVKESLEYIREQFENPKPVEFSDEEFEGIYEICNIFADFYRPTIEVYAERINAMSKLIPSRRERVQHIGLFGYGREVGKVSLPRAIKFTASCYSMGVPPEFIGTGRALRKVKELGKMDLLRKHFSTIEHELKHAGKFLNKENLAAWAETESWAADILDDVKGCEEVLGIELGPVKDRHLLHKNLTASIKLKQSMGLDMEDDVLEAAILRKSLG
ncbi:MAG: phosphoenolpyruvate carboxylase [Oceanicoccus sp.]|jgi:phosphoenolpyruvate carboxylase